MNSMITDKQEKTLFGIPLRLDDIYPSVPPPINPPYELDEIMLTFGDIFNYVNQDGSIKRSWEEGQMGFADIPFTIPFSSYSDIKVGKIYCHKKLISTFTKVFQVIYEKNLHRHIHSYGGCYVYRNKNNQTHLSTHCWGIAIDLNPHTNAPGTRGDMNSEIVRVFQSHGFEWGGSWKKKYRNPMHFQWCSGY